MTQSSPITMKTMNLINLTKNMNFTPKCSECLAYKLILNCHVILINVVTCGHWNSLGTTWYALKEM